MYLEFSQSASGAATTEENGMTIPLFHPLRFRFSSNVSNTVHKTAELMHSQY